MIALKIFIGVLEFYFLFYTWFLFLTVVGALVFRLRYRQPPQTQNHHRFAIMIPAYKANKQILHVINAAINQIYPVKHFDVFVLAQQCEPEIVDAMREKEITVFEQTFDGEPGNPYLFALNYFIQAIEREGRYDAIILIDKDNLMDDHCLALMNRRMQLGNLAVQGRRRPLNLDTAAACMDYVSEAMNDQMLRAAKQGIGLSAEVSGSCMAFEFELYKKAIANVDFLSPVHDKTFYLQILHQHQEVVFEPGAMVYEEKTGSFADVSTQRTRWVGGQFYLMKKYVGKLIKMGIKERSIHPIDYAVTLAKIPRSLHIVGLVFWLLFAAVLPSLSWISATAWLFYLFGYGAAILLLLAIDGAPWPVYRALLKSPLFVWSMLKSTLKSTTRNIAGTFIHTRHDKEMSIDEVKKQHAGKS